MLLHGKNVHFSVLKRKGGGEGVLWKFGTVPLLVPPTPPIPSGFSSNVFLVAPLPERPSAHLVSIFLLLKNHSELKEIQSHVFSLFYLKQSLVNPIVVLKFNQQPNEKNIRMRAI